MINWEVLASLPSFDNADLFFFLPPVQSWGAFSSLLFSSHPLSTVSLYRPCLCDHLLFSLSLGLVFQGSVPLASLAAHLSEIRSAAELEL